LSQELFEACATGDFETAERIRASFIPLEDLRDLFGPAKVLHAATELAGIAPTGPVPPYLTALTADQEQLVAPVARSLFASDKLQSLSAK
jgi:dihydrodipicolinate synthase/N-acetylneuraminate lyase